jgi:hypothetical protein
MKVRKVKREPLKVAHRGSQGWLRDADGGREAHGGSLQIEHPPSPSVIDQNVVGNLVALPGNSSLVQTPSPAFLVSIPASIMLSSHQSFAIGTLRTLQSGLMQSQKLSVIVDTVGLRVLELATGIKRKFTL